MHADRKYFLLNPLQCYHYLNQYFCLQPKSVFFTQKDGNQKCQKYIAYMDYGLL